MLSFKFWIAIIVLYFIGQSLHLYLLFRAQVHPPLDGGYTDTISKLIPWITMEQYGEKSNLELLFNRRAPLWNYQINYMYLRYFGWNFLGKEGLATFFGSRIGILAIEMGGSYVGPNTIHFRGHDSALGTDLGSPTT